MSFATAIPVQTCTSGKMSQDEIADVRRQARIQEGAAIGVEPTAGPSILCGNIDVTRLVRIVCPTLVTLFVCVAKNLRDPVLWQGPQNIGDGGIQGGEYDRKRPDHEGR
jgi:hypothetical protein